MYKLLTVILCVVALGHARSTVSKLGFRLGERNTHGPRIVGGEPANLGEFPYQISYQVNGEHMCGGTILTKNVVLSAGHCVTLVPIPPGGRAEIVAGIVSLKNESEYVQRIGVSQRLVHPDYAGQVGPNDLSLFYLNDSLVFNEYVQPVLLPENNTIPTGTVTLSGWGSTSDNFSPIYPDNLQKVDLPVLSQEDCKNGLNPADQDTLADTNVCTGPLPGSLAACSGDSGGPLVVKGNGNTTIVGIVSWGYVPCGHDRPSVYTRVSAFVDFIQQNLVR